MQRTKVFFDTEFTGLHQSTTLISIGLVAEDGRTFYAELTDYDKTQLDVWLRENVIAHLMLNDISDSDWQDQNIEAHGSYLSRRHPTYKGPLRHLHLFLKPWLEDLGEVEMWSDCLAYDWVLFCEIFGGAFGVPKNVYYIPFDLCTLFKIAGVDPDINREEYSGNHGFDAKHNALHDAQVIKKCYEKLAQVIQAKPVDYKGPWR